MMGTKWREQKRDSRNYVRPRRDFVPVIAALVLLVVASAVHFVIWPVSSDAAETIKFRMYGDLTGDGGAIHIVKVRGDRCLQAEDSTKLRLVAWRPVDKVVVYRCVTP